MNFKSIYKTGGTKSCKPSKNDKAMVSGVSSILKKIKDRKNRKEVAGSMVKQFNREGVSYNKEKFLKNSRSYQYGGASSTDRIDRSLYDPSKPWNKPLLPKEIKESITSSIPAEPYLIRPFDSLYGDDKIRAIVKYGDPSKVPTIGVDLLQLRREYPDVNKYKNTEKPKAVEVKKYGGSINKGAKLSKLYKTFKLRK